MKDVEHSFEVDARPDEILNFLLDDEFVRRLESRLDRVSNIEVQDLEQLGDGQIRRVGRFTAPTELPRPLRRFKDKAPDNVHWEEIWNIDSERHRIDTEIVADVPEHWHDYYENRGEIHIEPLDGGRCRVTQRVSFELDAPTGFGMFLNRSVKKVLGEIFDAHEGAVQERFG